jgi:hypothetical protein
MSAVKEMLQTHGGGPYVFYNKPTTYHHQTSTILPSYHPTILPSYHPTILPSYYPNTRVKNGDS